MANQFWLHPRIEELRAAGDQRSVAAIVLRHFPALVAVELVLGMSVLFIAPFLHGSARNQAYQASIAKQITKPTPAAELPKLPQQRIIASDWVFGTGQTVAVVAVMVVGYSVSGRIARTRRTTSVPAGAGAGPNNLTGWWNAPRDY
jgi:hypothetical protein